MLTLNRKKHCEPSVGIAITVLAVAHIAAGVLLCKNACHTKSTFPKVVKKAKRTVVGLVREFL